MKLSTILIAVAILSCDNGSGNAPTTLRTPTANAELLVEWGSLPNGLSIYRDEKNGNLVYICAKGGGGQSSPPTTAIFVVPIPKKDGK